MPGVGAPDRRDAVGEAGGGEPIGDRRADRAARVWAFAVGARRLAGDEQEDAVATREGTVETLIEQRVGGVERVAVQVERRVRLRQAAREAAVPGAV